MNIKTFAFNLQGVFLQLVIGHFILNSFYCLMTYMTSWLKTDQLLL